MDARREVQAHVEALAGAIGERHLGRPEALEAAAAYIEATWQRQGHGVRRQTYRASGIPCANLEVTLQGRTPEILLVGAHYDTVPGSPGADDNASGVAALLAISRILAQERLAKTLRFVAFVNEEPPFFFRQAMGSMVYAREARRRGDAIRLMVSLEMLGFYSDAPGSQRYPPLFRYFYPDKGNFIAFVSNFRSRRAMIELFKAFTAHADVPAEHVATFAFIPGVAWSDHLSFWRQGYRALMVTDTAFYRNPHYHTPRDTPDTLDYPRLAKVAEGLAGALGNLARRP
ncbi:MAG: M20/M25/M40 family metallo-hydrolase [Gammaproteobacteria bacterium]|nr:MAG: M20/M25/M40 family metallo-hydrolase [Gammaproteobacteria bacterium]